MRVSDGVDHYTSDDVEEFAKLPETGAYICELRKREVVQMTRPVFGHVRVQHRIQRLLAEAAGDPDAVYTEAPFRPLLNMNYGCRCCLRATGTLEFDSSGGYLAGAPDLGCRGFVARPIPQPRCSRKEQICLENGCREFWIVDLDRPPD